MQHQHNAFEGWLKSVYWRPGRKFNPNQPLATQGIRLQVSSKEHPATKNVNGNYLLSRKLNMHYHRQ